MRARLVAQVSNLLYRRFLIGRALVATGASELSHSSQVGNLRYSRLPVCATPEALLLTSFFGDFPPLFDDQQL